MGSLATIMAKVPMKGGDLGATFFRLPPGLTLAEWKQAAQRVTSIGYAYWWWVADLAYYARHHFTPAETKVAIEELARACGCRTSRIYELAVVGRDYAVAERVKGISITHHVVVRTVEKGRRHALLTRAAAQGWPVRVLVEKMQRPEERLVTVVFKVPALVAREKRFERATKAFAEAWTAETFVWGTVRPRRAQRVLGKV
jgi:hypothetical protein